MKNLINTLTEQTEQWAEKQWKRKNIFVFRATYFSLFSQIADNIKLDL